MTVRKKKNIISFQREKKRAHDREIGERECRARAVTHNQLTRSSFFPPGPEHAKSKDLRWAHSMRRGVITGRQNYMVLEPILRVIPRYYVEIIIIDCLLAA